jgi:hypothetical protein
MVIRTFSVSPDGSQVCFDQNNEDTSNDVMLLSMESGEVEALVATEGLEGGGRFSPDGRWLAYQNEGAPGINLVPWPSLDRRYVLDPTGADPKWLSATEIAYWSPPFGPEEASTGASLWRISIDPDAANPVGERRLIIEDPRFADTPGPSFAVLTGGDLAYKHTPTENLGLYFRVVPGWVEEMKRAVDEANR